MWITQTVGQLGAGYSKMQITADNVAQQMPNSGVLRPRTATLGLAVRKQPGWGVAIYAQRRPGMVALAWCRLGYVGAAQISKARGNGVMWPVFLLFAFSLWNAEEIERQRAREKQVKQPNSNRA